MYQASSSPGQAAEHNSVFEFLGKDADILLGVSEVDESD